MALAAATVWEVRTAGNDTNGGGFVAGASGTDYSQQDAKNTVGSDISTTDAVAVGTTTITSLTANFGTSIVGNIVYFAGGTGSIAGQWRQVTARASTTSITIDTAIAASTGMTMNIGGALASPGQLGAIFVNNNVAYIKNGTYSITSASTNVSGGCWSNSNTGRIIGYGTIRAFGNIDTSPLLQVNVSTTTLWNGSQLVYNLNLDGNSQTAAKPIANGIWFNCQFRNFNVSPTGGPVFIGCLSTGNSITIFMGSSAYYCEAYANTASGFTPASGSVINCLSYGNTGGSSDGFTANASNSTRFLNCVAYGNGRNGFTGGESTITTFQNCIAESNTGVGFTNGDPTNNIVTATNCGFFSNTGGNITAPGTTLSTYAINCITGSGSFFTNAAAADFSLNNTSGAGASLREAGTVTVASQLYPRGLTRSYLSIGAAEPLATGGGGMRLAGAGGLAAG